MLPPELGGGHAAARVHHASRRCGGCVAARSARAAGRARCDASAYSWPQPRTIRHGRPASGRSCRRWRSWAGPLAATCGSTPAGPEAMPNDIRRHAAELAALAPDVILAHGSSTVGPMLQATRTVPIVFPVIADPVGAGLRRQPGAAGRQRHRFPVFRIQHQREMAGAAQSRSHQA